MKRNLIDGVCHVGKRFVYYGALGCAVEGIVCVATFGLISLFVIIEEKFKK